MELSIFLAKVMGLYLLILSAAVVVNRRHLHSLQTAFLENPALTMSSGAIILILGLLVVVGHNVWSPDWRVVITLLGWLTLVKGLGRLLMPCKVAQVARQVRERGLLVVSILSFFLGSCLSYLGFLGGL